MGGRIKSGNVDHTCSRTFGRPQLSLIPFYQLLQWQSTRHPLQRGTDRLFAQKLNAKKCLKLKVVLVDIKLWPIQISLRTTLIMTTNHPPSSNITKSSMVRTAYYLKITE